MRKRWAGMKMAVLAAAAVMMLAGCGKSEEDSEKVYLDETEVEDDSEASHLDETEAEDDSEKAYLDEIKAEDYVKIGEYKGLEIEAPPEVTEEDLDSYIDYLLLLDPIDGAKEGDTVDIDYVGTLDGVPFDGGTDKGKYLQLGSGEFIEGFEEGLIGAKAGDTVELNLTFPDNYRPEMAGKSVVFTVTVNRIIAAEPQELNDEYVKGLDMDCDTVAEYRRYVFDYLVVDAWGDYEREMEVLLVSTLLENSEFTKEPPQAMVDGYAGMLTDNLTAEAEASGMTLEQYVNAAFGMGMEAYTNMVREMATWYVQQSIVLQAVADKENISVSEEELREELEEIVEASDFYSSVEELEEAADARRYKESMMGKKVIEFMRENAVVGAEG